MIRESLQYTHPFNYERNYRGLDVGLDVGDASEKSVGSLNLELKQKFYYLFDLRDEWWHEITFEKTVENDGGKYPRILLKRGESPPQYLEGEDGYE